MPTDEDASVELLQNAAPEVIYVSGEDVRTIEVLETPAPTIEVSGIPFAPELNVADLEQILANFLASGAAVVTPAQLDSHVNSSEPHPEYDDTPSLKILFENGLV